MLDIIDSACKPISSSFAHCCTGPAEEALHISCQPYPGYFQNILAVLISDLLLTSRNTLIAGTLNLCLKAWIHVLDPCTMAIFFSGLKPGQLEVIFVSW